MLAPPKRSFESQLLKDRREKVPEFVSPWLFKMTVFIWGLSVTYLNVQSVSELAYKNK